MAVAVPAGGERYSASVCRLQVVGSREVDVPLQPATSRRLTDVALWPFGISLTSWNYVWRITPLHRRELPGDPSLDDAPRLTDAVSHEGLQTAGNGVGPLFHRRYTARIVGSQKTPEELMDDVQKRINKVAPTEFARFVKVAGEKGDMQAGDEYVVHMPGPWNGPVRVVDVSPTSFRLATMQGHLEAGQIEFRASAEDEDEDEGGGALVFTIESWARSGDRLSSLMYGKLRMAKEVQLHMWTSFLEGVAKRSGGRLARGIDVDTRRLDADTSRPDPNGVLDELHGKAVNYEAGPAERFTAEEGWKVDEYCQPLPGEAPGPPEPGGSWEVAQQLMRDYEFADPSIVRAVYHRDRPLENRDMLLVARFYGLRFRLGVRIGGVIDETRHVDGRPVRVWGWNYRTLQGHLEMGQMDYEVWKWTDTGEVQFRTCRYSKHAAVGNPVVRLGLRLFGRRQQVRFAERACARMATLTAAALEGRRPADVRVASAADRIDVRTEPAPTSTS
jgi:uncharacterized protein (UPF0548 family)